MSFCSVLNMSDNIYAPLSSSCVRLLTDKLYEKRKGAALEIEKLVRQLVLDQQLSQVEKIMEVLGDLARSHNPHTRNGGLIGLAATAIALGRLTPSYTSLLIRPVVECFSDSDSRVRYYACEALYNIVKVAREAVVPHFSSLFDTLCKLSADTDQNVRNGSELLDRLLKDIVTSSSNFQISEFVALLKERIYTKNTLTRQFLVSWVQALNAVPTVKLLPYLPEILDGFFQILADPTPTIREACEAALGEFLRSIIQDSKNADLQTMVNVLIVHAHTDDDLLQYMSLIWLREFLRLDGQGMLAYTSGYLTACLPSLEVDDERRKSIREVAKSVNENLLKLVTEDTKNIEKHIDLVSVMMVLRDLLQSNTQQTRLAVLTWIHKLYKRLPQQMFSHMEDLFPLLLRLLSDDSDEVVFMNLEVLADVCCGSEGLRLSMDSLHLSAESLQVLQGTSPYFVQFLFSLLEMFRRDLSLLADRGHFIIRQLCVLLKAESVFLTISVLLTYDQTDCDLPALVVQTLNSILLTAPETNQLRQRLRNLNDKEVCDLFVCLYRCWCHQPVAVLALCLLSQNYAHAAQLVLLFADLEVTVEFLTEIDKLIQLIESPIFTSLRLQLLDATHQRHLSTVLYGLLMMLPQTDAFQTLYRRLQSMPPPLSQSSSSAEKSATSKSGGSQQNIPWQALLDDFRRTQAKQQQHRSEKRKLALSQAR